MQSCNKNKNDCKNISFQKTVKITLTVLNKNSPTKNCQGDFLFPREIILLNLIKYYGHPIQFKLIKNVSLNLFYLLPQ